MPIKAVDFTPREFKLDRLDPSGETWVKVKHRTWQDDLQRGEFLRSKRYQGMSVESNVNSYALMELEIWLSYDSCHVVIEQLEGESLAPFKPRDQMDRSSFIEALRQVGKLVPDLILDWHDAAVSVNEIWRLPF